MSSIFGRDKVNSTIFNGNSLPFILVCKLEKIGSGDLVFNLYHLRTSNCYNHLLLLQFDTILKSGLSVIFNFDFHETQWIQATLPVNDGGNGIRCANMLATSAFLASAASTHILQQSILLLSSHNQVPYQDRVSIEAMWSPLSSANTPDQ